MYTMEYIKYNEDKMTPLCRHIWRCWTSKMLVRYILLRFCPRLSQFSQLSFMQYQCLWNWIGTSAFADVSYLMADVEAKFYVQKCTEHQPKCSYLSMLVNIVLQMLQYMGLCVFSLTIYLMMTLRIRIFILFSSSNEKYDPCAIV